MRIQYMTCPRCGGEVHAENLNKIHYCSYCGAPLLIDDEVDRSIQTTVIRDEARLKEAENEARRLDLEEQRLQYERELHAASLQRTGSERPGRTGSNGTAGKTLTAGDFFRVFFAVMGIIFVIMCTLCYVLSPIDLMSGIVLDDIIIIYLCVRAIRRIGRKLERYRF